MKIDRPSKAILRDPKARRHWIVFAFQSNGGFVSDVAKANGITRQCIYHCLHKPYPRMEKLVAEALGMTPQELFPERYDHLGLPNRMHGRPAKKISCHDKKNKRSVATRNMQMAQAA